ncbi:ATP-binding protein [Microbacterium arabinogalactanolyticum]|uniref:ATP-binding protein n=1 Tax=Microbacterium arabinogalactanolyticum TaxID=69365 RepID=UPI00255714FE|nr:ATP-binding protein [Microbacterium arabinogalactanolyticum]GLC86224.1 putative two-component system sensor kinase [Microbacterium arabinogalactanolyticum]
MSSSAQHPLVPLARPPRAVPPPRPELTRARECLISGTAEGLARHLGVSTGLVRAMFIALTVLSGAGVLLYVWCWVFTPWEPGKSAPSRKAPVAWVLLAVGALLELIMLQQLGTGYMLGVYLPDLGVDGSMPMLLDLGILLLGPVVLLVGAALWADLIDRIDPTRGPRQAGVVRGIAVVLLVVMVVAMVARPTGPVLLLAPFAGLLAMFASSLMHRWRELSGERVRRIREEQRSEMAAHLHDSVLQTLALIQNRAGASSEAARLARAQERELRAWLYDGDAPADSDLPTDLRDYAGALELDYPVHIDVVSAGLSTERASGELAAAAREAMLNAARHAGGEVSVYIEGSTSGVDVFIRDRGAGFDLDEVPGDRLGVRQSIIGRMRRAGGSGTVRSDENGTEVHLRIAGAPLRSEDA